MTLNFQRYPKSAGLLQDEDVLPQLLKWRAEGQKAVLVTLVGIEGGSPRHPGAQMAVAEDGRSAGYLSGGCLEGAVVHEAQAVMSQSRNRLVRYGLGSPYFDIKLPCGSGLDLYFDQAISLSCLSDVAASRARRQRVILTTDLSSGLSKASVVAASAPFRESGRDGDLFMRYYTPTLRLMLIGNGPALAGMAQMAQMLGCDVTIAASDEATLISLAQAGQSTMPVREMDDATFEQLDFASAAVLFFHAHDEEPGILRHLVKTDCFYIGALGNHAVHRARLLALKAAGAADSDISRIRAPMGSIANAKTKATLAVSVLAELMGEAKARHLVA